MWRHSSKSNREETSSISLVEAVTYAGDLGEVTSLHFASFCPPPYALLPQRQFLWRTRGFGGRRGDFNQPGNAQDKERNVNGVQVDREKDGFSSRSADVEEAGREDKLVSTVDVDAGKENVVLMPEEEVVGAVTRSRVIVGMVDENVKEGVHVAVMVKADYSDNAGVEERVGVKSQIADSGTLCVSPLEDISNIPRAVVTQGAVFQKQKRWKRRAREKGDIHIADSDAAVRKRSLEEEEELCGLWKRG
ncbi:hypothetical protein ACOSP7_023337 [Xanthoceras sorbifolium]